MNYNTTIYNINFELDIYKAMMKCPYNTNSKSTIIEPISKLYNSSKIEKIKNVNNDCNFDYTKVITKNIYNQNNEYEKVKENKFGIK